MDLFGLGLSIYDLQSNWKVIGGEVKDYINVIYRGKSAKGRLCGMNKLVHFSAYGKVLDVCKHF